MNTEEVFLIIEENETAKAKLHGDHLALTSKRPRRTETVMLWQWGGCKFRQNMVLSATAIYSAVITTSQKKQAM